MDAVPLITFEQFKWSMEWAPWNVYGPPAFNEAVFTPQQIEEFARAEFRAFLKFPVH
jgi:hypothetical protein